MRSTLLHEHHPAAAIVTPAYLEPHDAPWLRALIEAFRRFEGRSRRELDAYLREPLRCPSPKPKRDAATRILHRLCRTAGPPPGTPRRLRAALFTAAARADPDERGRVRKDVAARYGLSVPALDAALFADLPSERVIAAVPATLSPLELAARTNLDIAQRSLRRATEVALELKGNARAVIRVARLQGLIAAVQPVAGAEAARGDYAVRIAISGPLALFRKTLVYGRALASLLPPLAWCERFRLLARCGLAERPTLVEIRTGDPIFPGDEPAVFDSRLEARFAREFLNEAPEWDVVREPEPVAVGESLIFPDFLLEHRRDRRAWLLEIVGFWTPAYLHHKLEALRKARVDNLIVCIDERRNCDADDVPPHARVIRFRNKIDPHAVLAIIEPLNVSSGFAP